MTFIKESYKGLLFIIGVFVLNIGIWLLSSPIFEQPLESTLAQIMGSTIIVSFSIVFLLSTKNRVVTWLFHGLENLYKVHRQLAVFSIVFIFIHAQTSHLIWMNFRSDLPFNPIDFGPLARNLFIFLILMAILAKYMKYEHFKMIHRFMVVPYMLSIYHAFFLSSYDLMTLSVIGVWMSMVALTGVLSSLYMIVFYGRLAFVHKGTVKNITQLNETILEIELELSETLNYKTGQFVFVEIPKAPFHKKPHPFSISGVNGNTLYFTIKALGDYTKDLQTHLKVGDTIKTTRAYGHMTFNDYSNHQVWIAGGIGITPFLSHLRAHNPPTQNITLYYSVRTLDEAVHLDDLKALAASHKNFSYHVSESDKEGFLHVDQLALDDSTTVFMCGPVPMAKALKKQFKHTTKHERLVYEAFSFTGTFAEDTVQFFKRLIRKFKSA